MKGCGTTTTDDHEGVAENYVQHESTTMGHRHGQAVEHVNNNSLQSSHLIPKMYDLAKSALVKMANFFLCCSKRKRGYEDDGHVAKEPRMAEEVRQHFAFRKMHLK